MDEDLINWNLVKVDIEKNQKRPRIYPRVGEIWWCSIGYNVGSECRGKGERFLRPVIIIKNYNSRIFLGIPTTTKEKPDQYRIDFVVNNQKVKAIISQIRTLDTKRLLRKIGSVSIEDLFKIKKALKDNL